MGHGGLACNRCAKEIDDGSQVLTTGCMHCFCLECANSICKGDNACSVCGEKLNADNVSVEICRNSDSDVFSLRGAGPADVIMVVSDALVFNETQRNISAQAHAKAHKDKHKDLLDSSKSKLAEMHVAYKNLVAKVKTFANEKSDKADLLEELRSKAQQHSRMCRKLEEQLKACQQKSKVMQQHVGLTAGASPTSSSGRLPSLQPPCRRPQSHSRHLATANHVSPHQDQAAAHPGRQPGTSQAQTLRSRLHGSRHVAGAGGGIVSTSPTLMAHGGSPSDLNISSVSAPSGISGLSGMLCEAGFHGGAVGKHDNSGQPLQKRKRNSSGSTGSLTALIKSRRK